MSQPPIVLVDKVSQLLVAPFALRFATFGRLRGASKTNILYLRLLYYFELNLIQINTVAQRRGFIYFIFERLRGDRRRNCMSILRITVSRMGQRNNKIYNPRRDWADGNPQQLVINTFTGRPGVRPLHRLQ